MKRQSAPHSFHPSSNPLLFWPLGFHGGRLVFSPDGWGGGRAIEVGELETKVRGESVLGFAWGLGPERCTASGPFVLDEKL